MSFVIEAKWLVLIPLIPTMMFVGWVFWNLSREIWLEKRTYGGRKMGVARRQVLQTWDVQTTSARSQSQLLAFPHHHPSPPPAAPNQERYQS